MEETSIKQLIQSLAPENPTVVEGTVLTASPLSIVLKNDAKMVLSANSLVVPRYLTDHQVEVDIRKASGSLDSETAEDEGEHEHEELSTEDGQHIHHLSTFELETGVLFIYNALKQGESVLLLEFDSGKRYFVLDRKG
ncbi:MAG: DUF2577 domain-containing protein [Clostridiales bacterium]|nr:DUF2577 domain-containing protein [Clostridiales bacterium]